MVSPVNYIFEALYFVQNCICRPGLTPQRGLFLVVYEDCESGIYDSWPKVKYQVKAYLEVGIKYIQRSLRLLTV